MAHARELPESTLDELANRLAGAVAPLIDSASLLQERSSADRDEAAVAESFPVWLLTEKALDRRASRLSELLEETGIWRHQVSVSGTAVAYAESYRSPETGEHQYRGLFPDPLARAVDLAIDEIDEIDPSGDPEVRLVVAPTLELTAFWIVGDHESRFLVVDQPGGREDLRHVLFSDKEFLAKVRRLPKTGGRMRPSEG